MHWQILYPFLPIQRIITNDQRFMGSLPISYVFKNLYFPILSHSFSHVQFLEHFSSLFPFAHLPSFFIFIFFLIYFFLYQKIIIIIILFLFFSFYFWLNNSFSHMKRLRLVDYFVWLFVLFCFLSWICRVIIHNFITFLPFPKGLQFSSFIFVLT